MGLYHPSTLIYHHFQVDCKTVLADMQTGSYWVKKRTVPKRFPTSHSWDFMDRYSTTNSPSHMVLIGTLTYPHNPIQARLLAGSRELIMPGTKD